MEQKEVQRRAAESLFADEIAALKAAEQNEVPEGWNMSPRSVLTYILGGKAGDKVIGPKYIGDRRHQRGFGACRAGHGRYDRGADSLLLELCALDCRGPE